MWLPSSRRDRATTQGRPYIPMNQYTWITEPSIKNRSTYMERQGILYAATVPYAFALRARRRRVCSAGPSYPPEALRKSTSSLSAGSRMRAK